MADLKSLNWTDDQVTEACKNWLGEIPKSDSLMKTGIILFAALIFLLLLISSSGVGYYIYKKRKNNSYTFF